MVIKHFYEGCEFHFSSYEGYSIEETFISNSFTSQKTKEKRESASASKENQDKNSRNLNIEKITSNIKHIYI